ncbi:SAVED domain-containing protein [Candidatus Uabimicrobium sp. HlEnr_7]|uniref:SAVED domain-containing protein n=1 Tax=Candidatus Uabimicrobium helgolandensis TaxID=3095367 RepID=UPI003555DF42
MALDGFPKNAKELQGLEISEIAFFAEECVENLSKAEIDFSLRKMKIIATKITQDSHLQTYCVNVVEYLLGRENYFVKWLLILREDKPIFIDNWLQPPNSHAKDRELISTQVVYFPCQSNKSAELIPIESEKNNCKPIKISIDTYDPLPTNRKNYNLCWSTYFDNRNIRNTKYWNTKLLTKIKKLKKIIHKKEQGKTIELSAKCFLSVGIAFGYIFSQPSGYKIEIKQDNDFTKQEELWKTTDTSEEFEIKKILSNNFRVNQKELCLTISITRDISGAVKQYVAHKKMIATHLEIAAKVTGRDCIRNSAQANFAAKEVSEGILEICSEHQFEKIHLFYSGPLALAIFIGHRLNTIGELQLYEYDGHQYSPSFCLNRR